MMNYNFNISELMFVMPELFLLAAISSILLFDLYVKEEFKKYTYHLSQAALLVTGLLAFNLIGESCNHILWNVRARYIGIDL